jgi:hypothetical protein
MANNNGHFMRSGQHNNKRGRNRNRRHGGGGGGGGNYGGGSPGNRVLDSNGPDVKLRGTAQTIAEKYMQLGRDAQLAGDTVMSESYYQHGEHYYRLWLANQPAGQIPQFSRRPGEEEFEDESPETEAEGEDDNTAEAPAGDAPEHTEQTEGAEAGGDTDQQGQNRNFRNRDGRDNREGRDGQNRDGGRERFRNRWPRRDRNSEQRAEQEGGRPERESVAAEESAETGNWETPSFLTRPMPAVAMDGEQPVEAVPERRPRREPRPKRDVVPESNPDDPVT